MTPDTIRGFEKAVDKFHAADEALRSAVADYPPAEQETLWREIDAALYKRKR
jgi:hypothetical protein